MNIECTKCHEIKDELSFTRDKQKPTGYRRECKQCQMRKRPTYYARKEKLSVGQKRCKQCKKALSVDLFHKDPTKSDGYYSICKDCRRQRTGQKKHVPNLITSDGYVRDGRARQHRRIMENVLGRKLEKWEHVHHINGVKTDNRLENLMLLTKSEHHSYHSKILANLRKNGQIFACNSCGDRQYKPKSAVFDRHETIEAYAKSYLCKKCYYKSKRWLDGLTKESMLIAQKKSVEARLKKTSGKQAVCKYCKKTYDLPPQKYLWGKYCSTSCHQLDRSEWSKKRWEKYRNNKLKTVVTERR